MRGNFGARKFSYAAGQLHCAAADSCLDNTQDMMEMFNVLPFFLPPLAPPPPSTPQLAPLASLEELGDVDIPG